MADVPTAWTPPRPLFRHAHPTRLDRASIDSSSSLATTNLQTPDRANFPRFASPIAEAGASCGRPAEGVEGDEEENVWEDMESGGLLEVKIGNLLNVSFPLLPFFPGGALGSVYGEEGHTDRRSSRLAYPTAFYPLFHPPQSWPLTKTMKFSQTTRPFSLRLIFPRGMPHIRSPACPSSSRSGLLGRPNALYLAAIDHRHRMQLHQYLAVLRSRRHRDWWTLLYRHHLPWGGAPAIMRV